MTVDGVNRKVHNTGTHTCVHADSQAEAPVHTDTHAHTRTGTQAHQTTVCMQARPCACARAHNVVTQLHSTHQPCHRPVDLQALLLAQSNTHTYLHTHVLTRTHTYTHTHVLTRTHTHTGTSTHALTCCCCCNRGCNAGCGCCMDGGWRWEWWRWSAAHTNKANTLNKELDMQSGSLCICSFA